MAICRPQQNKYNPDLDLELCSTSFDDISLTQMFEPNHRATQSAIPWVSQRSQEYRDQHRTLKAKVKENHPAVPAAPNLLRRKPFEIHGGQTQFRSSFEPHAIDRNNIISHEDVSVGPTCSAQKSYQYVREQESYAKNFNDSSNFLVKSNVGAKLGTSHQSAAMRKKKVPLNKSSLSSKTYEAQRNSQLIRREEHMSQRTSNSWLRNAPEHLKDVSGEHCQLTQFSDGSKKGNPIVGGIQLRSVDEIPRQFQEIFEFPYFNVLQSLLLDDVLYTDKSLVASAPTGSGKTVIFELALIRLLKKSNFPGFQGKIIYMAPMKALCTERFIDWNNKFGKSGVNCLEITGDSELDDFTELFNANLICTTPEKWDSMSRRWKDNKKLFQQIQLFFIDEVHILNDSQRGATVEAVVSRMKTLETAQELDNTTHIRFVAVSATMPNYKDIAEWLGTPSKPASAFNLGEEFRPVKLDRIVLGYPFKEGTSDFRFDMNLSYRLKSIIETHSHGKPALVFCSSRKSVVQSAEALAGDLRTNNLLIRFNAEALHAAAMSVHEHKLSELLHRGIGIHHAGLDIQDRHTVEELFKASKLPVLISTSTLAMGVNLPAHLVVVKSTHFYNMGMVQEYSNMQLLQMIGRAGRPQFDTSATAVIMTKAQLKSKYSTLVNGTQLIESSLHKNLIEHLNAEIVLQTISDMSLVVEWIRHTFLYVRALKNPCYYGLSSNLSTQEVEKKLQDLCLQNVTLLTNLNLVSINDKVGSIWPTDRGKLMARYCIAFETMKQFSCIDESQENIAEMIKVIAHCAEFDDIQLRINEKRILNSLNRDKNKETIRFPLPGKIKTKQMKVNCLIQAQLSCLPVQDFSLSQDMAKIFRVGQRVAKCMMEYLYQGNSYSILLHSILVYKAFKTKLWFDSRYVARQLEGIGPTMALALANSGLSSFHKLDEAHPRDIEVIVNRHPPFGNQVKESLTKLPRYELAVEQMKCYKPHKCVLVLSVELINRSAFEEVPSSQITHQSVLIVGDADNNIVFKWRVFDAAIIRDGMLTRTVEVNRASKGIKLSISLLNQDTVGLDIQTEYEPIYQEGWFPSCSRLLTSKDQTPSSKLKAAMDKGKAESSSTSLQLKSSCNHKCVNKSTCGHKCCKSSDVRKRPGTEMLSDAKPETNNKAAKLEKSSYRESKDMKEIRSIFGGHHTGSRLTMNKFPSQVVIPVRSQERSNCSKKNEMCASTRQNSLMTSNSNEFEGDNPSDVIILDDDIFEAADDFEESSCTGMVSTPKPTEGHRKSASTINSDAGTQYHNNAPVKSHTDERQLWQYFGSATVQKQKTLCQNIQENKVTPGSLKNTATSGKQEHHDFLVVPGKENSSKEENSRRTVWEEEELTWKRQGLQKNGGMTSKDEKKPQAHNALDIGVNGWADLDAFHQSRQTLFKDGRPIHLRDDEWLESDNDLDEELPSLTSSPDPRFSLPMGLLQQGGHHSKQQPAQTSSNDVECTWATTTSSDEELCCLVDGVTSPSNESNSLRLNNRISLETSCSDQTAYSKTHEVKTIHDLTGPNTLTKPLDDISGTANISPLSEYQSQNLNSGSLDIKFKAHLQVQRSLVATCDVSEPRRHRPRPGESGLRLIPNDSQEHPDSRNVFRSSNTATQHSVDDTLSPSIITLTGSELSHCLSQSNGSKHSAETQYHHKTDSDKSHVQGFRRSVKASEKGLITNSECKNDFGRILSPHSEACAIDSCGCVETAEGGLQSSHRYGHVLAWNKASGSRSGQQSATSQRHEESEPKRKGFNFFNHAEGLQSEETSIISINLFDGIF